MKTTLELRWFACCFIAFVAVHSSWPVHGQGIPSGEYTFSCISYISNIVAIYLFIYLFIDLLID